MKDSPKGTRRSSPASATGSSSGGGGAASIEGLALRAALADPGSQPLQLAVQGSASADAGMVEWKLTGSLDSNRFDTSGQAAFARAVPHIKASARFDSLDLNQLLAADKPSAADTTTAAKATTTPAATEPVDTPVQLDGLKAVNGEFALDADALVFGQYKVADARLAATLANGLLRVSTLSGRAWGGSFVGSGSADANTGDVAAKLDARGVNVNALLKDVAAKDLLEGSGNVVADLESAGATVSALRSRLRGTAAMQVRNGAIKVMQTDANVNTVDEAFAQTGFDKVAPGTRALVMARMMDYVTALFMTAVKDATVLSEGGTPVRHDVAATVALAEAMAGNKEQPLP